MGTGSFRDEVRDFIGQYQLEIPLGDRMLDLTSEVGELAKEVLKGSDYGRQSFRPNEAWHDELGDVFFSLVCLANTTGVDLVEVLIGAITKYSARLDAMGEAGSR